MSRASWDAAFASYSEANRQFDEAIDRHTEAEEAASAVCPREDEYFDTYRLGIGMNRERVVSALQLYNASRVEQDRIDVNSIAEGFMALQQRHVAANQKFRVNDLDEAVAALSPAFMATRDALMLLPAPDQSALLAKIEIAFRSLDYDHAESALADAKRMLTA